jgi:glycosyltransferase involved in cell wall biosynthesis
LPEDGPKPFASVVVPSVGRTELLRECLEHLVAQDYPPDRYEVLVVENGARKPSPEIAALAADTASPSIIHLLLTEKDANAARNVGLDASRGDPICLIDDDSLAPPGWLSAMVAAAARNPWAGCLGGAVRPQFDRSPPRTCGGHELPGACLDEGPLERVVDEVWGCNMALRRDVLGDDGPGRFRQGMPYAQEWEWQQRLQRSGGTIVYVPAAWLWHRRLASDVRLRTLLPQFARRGYTIGAVRLALGAPIRRGEALRRAARGLAHLRHGAGLACSRGLTEGMKELGHAYALATKGAVPGTGQPAKGAEPPSSRR